MYVVRRTFEVGWALEVLRIKQIKQTTADGHKVANQGIQNAQYVTSGLRPAPHKAYMKRKIIDKEKNKNEETDKCKNASE